MAANDSWIYQGRQYHQWFGDGTSPKTEKPTALAGTSNPLFLPVNAGRRVDYVAHGIIARVPANARTIWNRAVTESARDNLKTAVAGWYGGAGLSRGAFRARFLDPSTSDETVDLLRSAAQGMVQGRSYEDLSKAGNDLATAAQQVGAHRWTRFLGDASSRAIDAVSRGTVSGIIKVSGDTVAEVGLVAAVLAGLAIILFKSQPDMSVPSQPGAAPPVLMATPPRDAKDPNGAKAPGKPVAEDGFEDPKRGEKWVPNPNESGSGWLDAQGDVWVPTGPSKDIAHGGPHWDVQTPGGRYRSAYPGGKVRAGR